MHSKMLAPIALLSVVLTVGSAFAQSDPHYVRFPGVPGSVKGALYLPDSPQQPPHVGIVVMPGSLAPTA